MNPLVVRLYPSIDYAGWATPTSDDEVATFMAKAFQMNNMAYIAHALNVVARAKSKAQIAG